MLDPIGYPQPPQHRSPSILITFQYWKTLLAKKSHQSGSSQMPLDFALLHIPDLCLLMEGQRHICLFPTSPNYLPSHTVFLPRKQMISILMYFIIIRMGLFFKLSGYSCCYSLFPFVVLNDYLLTLQP